MYRELFPINNGESDKEQIEKLLKCFNTSKNTNMEVLLKKCLDSL